MPDDNWSIIYSGNSIQADLLKSLLEGSGIQAVLEDEFLVVSQFEFPAR